MIGCSSSKFIPENEYLLREVEIKSDQKDFDAASLKPYVRQKANPKWFSLFNIPLGTYSLSGRDTTEWANRTLRKIGEEPALFDTAQANQSTNNLKKVLQNAGYIHAEVDLQAKIKGRKLKVIYTLHPGGPHHISCARYDIVDEHIKRILALDKSQHATCSLQNGSRFTVERLDEEHNRITKLLLDSGFYKFRKDFIAFEADSARNNTDTNLVIRLLKYHTNSDASETSHLHYFTHDVKFSSSEESGIHLRPKIPEYNTAIKVGEPLPAAHLQTTYNNFARLQAVRYTNIKFKESPDTTLLNCDIQLSHSKPHTLPPRLEGTSTAGDLGAAMSLTYENRDLSRGSEVLQVQLRGASEATTGLEGYNDQDYQEYNAETKLQFPRLLAPFLSSAFQRHSMTSSELSLSYNLQGRPGFRRRVLFAALRHRWNESKRYSFYRMDLIDPSHVYTPRISDTSKRDYSGGVSSRNAVLRYNYENLLVMKMGFGLRFNSGYHAMIASIETVGNILKGFSRVLSFRKNAQGWYTLSNTAYAQHIKGDFDYTRLITFDMHNSLALHIDLGLAYPYGNSKILPFEKRYFSGGVNSVRGWSVRELGPGSSRGTDGCIDFINQTGGMKLDMNTKYHTKLFRKSHGAVSADAGNIWTLRQYEEQPGGQSKLHEFYKQIAVAYGLGLCLNFDFSTLRLDMGVKATNPTHETQWEHFVVLHPNFDHDFTFHSAAGTPS